LGDMLSTLRQRLVTLLNVKDENASFGSLLRQVMSTWDHPNLQQIFQKSWKSLDNTTIELHERVPHDGRARSALDFRAVTKTIQDPLLGKPSTISQIKNCKRNRLSLEEWIGEILFGRKKKEEKDRITAEPGRTSQPQLRRTSQSPVSLDVWFPLDSA